MGTPSLHAGPAEVQGLGGEAASTTTQLRVGRGRTQQLILPAVETWPAYGTHPMAFAGGWGEGWMDG